MGRVAESEDPISGLIIHGGTLTADHFSAFETLDDSLYVARLNYYEQLETEYLIRETADLTDLTAADLSYVQTSNLISYNVREFFRQSPTGTLYLAVSRLGDPEAENVRSLQFYSEGKIRQVGIFTNLGIGLNTVFADLQTAARELEAAHQPLSIVFAPYNVLSLSALKSAAWSEQGRSNVSVLVGADLDPALVNLTGGKYACLGNLLGCLSAASVNESIAWVGKFPLGLTAPGLVTGELIKEVPAGDQDLLNTARLIFARTHVGVADCYFNDSHTLDIVTSDYAYIENVRTMDKATRGIRTNLLPYLNAPLYVDATTGKLRADTVASLETIAGRALESMERAGELSGYRVEINPEQNVLATSQLEVQIKNVPVGVMRKVLIKIGFSTKA